MNEYERILRPLVGNSLRLNEPLTRYTVARLGGPADALVIATTTDHLKAAALVAWQHGWPIRILGGGANVLCRDSGFRGLILVNDVKSIEIESEGEVLAQSGTALIALARETMDQGLSGFEWAIGVPGTVGGGIVNNAGAHGSAVAASLVEAYLFVGPDGRDETWPVQKLGYRYRESILKGSAEPRLVIAGRFQFSAGHDPAALRAHAEEFNAYRKRTQPPGASLGSMFKNPQGDFAGRLIEAAGLKGERVGGVMISPVHANFFVNTGGGSADDYLQLIELTQTRVHQQFGVALELEIEVIGDDKP